MRKRGRPPHPDILTPREWQVLDLLRQHYTNEQIAHRLDFSLATAKYHVSEILSKLGVATREEAAAWQPESVAVRWWQRATAWVPRYALPLAGAAVALAAAVGLGLLALGTWRTGGEGGDLTPDVGTTIADVHSGITQAITGDGMVLHMTVTTAAGSLDPRFQPNQDGEVKSEYWIDPANETARTAYSDVGPPRDVVVYTGGRFYYISGGDIAIPVSGFGPMCDGVGGVSALLLDYTYNNCPDNTEVLTGSRDGTAAIVLRQTWVFRNEDGDPTGGARVTRLYFDRDTYLPLGGEFEVDGFVKGGGSSSMTVEFVDRDSLSDDFFAAEAIGYVERCVQFRIESGGPACNLTLSPSTDVSGSLDNPEFVVAETIRLSTRPSIDIVQPQSAHATMISAQDAADFLDRRRETSPYIPPPDAVQGLRELNPDERVWLIEAPGVFGDRGGDSPRKPNPPLVRGTLLAVVVHETGDLPYSAVATP